MARLLDFERDSVYAWLVAHGFRTPKGDPLEFTSSPWLYDIVEDSSQVLCIRKSSQARISTTAIFKVLHFSIFNNVTSIFTQPTRDDAQKFSASRVAPILHQNPYFAQYVTGGTELLRISNVPGGPILSHIHFRGTFGEKEAFTIDADYVINDEVDQSNHEVISVFDTRLIASRWKRKLKISTPSIPNYGIDVDWALSDQRSFLWRCERCNRDIDPVEDFYRAIDREACIFRCPHCGKPINRARGRWVPKRPDAPIRGYQVTQGIMLYVPVAEIVVAERTKRPREFANFYLGVPSSEGVGQVTREMIEQKCFLSRHQRSLSAVGKRRCMGVDQGDLLYIEVAEVDGETGRSHIVQLDVTSEWDRIGQLIHSHEVECCVIDARPEIRMVRKLAADFPGRVFFCEFGNISEPVRWQGRERYHILANRTQVIDAAAENIASGTTQLYWPRDDFVDHEGDPSGWIQHWLNQRRVEPEQPDGLPVWKEVGPDHWSFADVYRCIAESRIRGRPVNTNWVATAGRRYFPPSPAVADLAAKGETEQAKKRVMQETPGEGLSQGPRLDVGPRPKQVLYKRRR